MGKYQVRYEDNNVQVKSRETADGYTTIIDNKNENISETYTSIHEGENRETVVDTHYSDGSRTVTVFDNSEDRNLLRQLHQNKNGEWSDAMPSDDWQEDEDEDED